MAMDLVTIPVFFGDSFELRPWIEWMENRFVLDDFTGLQKLHLAHGFIDGEAEAYVRWRQSFMLFFSWEDLKDALLLRFGRRDDPDRMRMTMENERFMQQLIKKQLDVQEADVSGEPESMMMADLIHGEEESRQKIQELISSPVSKDFVSSMENEKVTVTESIPENDTIEHENAIIHNESISHNQFIPQKEAFQHQVLISHSEPSRSVSLRLSRMNLVFANGKLGVKNLENPIFETLNEFSWIFSEESLPGEEVDVVHSDSVTQSLMVFRSEDLSSPQTRIHVDVMLKNRDSSLFFDGNVVAQFQILYGSESETYAYQVLDQMILRGDNVLHHRKMRKFPKSWMFKFKNCLEARDSIPKQLFFLDTVEDAKATRDGLHMQFTLCDLSIDELRPQHQSKFSNSWTFKYQNKALEGEKIVMKQNQFNPRGQIQFEAIKHVSCWLLQCRKPWKNERWLTIVCLLGLLGINLYTPVIWDKWTQKKTIIRFLQQYGTLKILRLQQKTDFRDDYVTARVVADPAIQVLLAMSKHGYQVWSGCRIGNGNLLFHTSLALCFWDDMGINTLWYEVAFIKNASDFVNDNIMVVPSCYVSMLLQPSQFVVIDFSKFWRFRFREQMVTKEQTGCIMGLLNKRVLTLSEGQFVVLHEDDQYRYCWCCHSCASPATNDHSLAWGQAFFKGGSIDKLERVYVRQRKTRESEEAREKED